MCFLQLIRKTESIPAYEKKTFSNMLCVNLDVTNPWAVRGGWPFDSGLSTGVDESKQRRLMDISKQAGAVKGPLRGPKFARKSV